MTIDEPKETGPGDDNALEERTRRERVAEAAARALAEADARRAALNDDAERPKELGGRNGPEPTRFGDWEKDGVISDF